MCNESSISALLYDCCDHIECRPGLRLPFTVPGLHGYVFATNLRIMVGAPARYFPGAAPLSEDLVPHEKVRRFMGSDTIEVVEWGKAPVQSAKKMPCGFCPTEKCKKCDGRGEITCSHCHGYFQCPDCIGRGSNFDENKVCRFCDGSRALSLHEVGDLTIAAPFAGIVLRNLGFETEWGVLKNWNARVYFRCGDVAGCIIAHHG